MAKRDGRTEQPTQRRRREARRDGNVARSPEAAGLVVLAAGLITAAITAPGALRTTQDVTRYWLGSASGTTGGMRGGDIEASAMRIIGAWSPIVLAAMVAGIVVQIAQSGVALAPKTARPSFKQLSLSRGLKRLSPVQAGLTLVRSLLKVVVVGLALIGPLRTLYTEIPRRDDLASVVGSVGRAAQSVAWRVVLGAILIGALDAVYHRRKWKRELMMTRQEIIDESKMTEGDPHMKAARKRRGIEIRRRSALLSVAKADVVITNPTHFAVALAYTDGSPAPQVIDKGTERAAKKIRKMATRHGVPIIEDKPLARALYRQVKVGGYVPEKFFDDVIKVLVAAYWRRGRFPDGLRGAATATAGRRN